MKKGTRIAVTFVVLAVLVLAFGSSVAVVAADSQSAWLAAPAILAQDPIGSIPLRTSQDSPSLVHATGIAVGGSHACALTASGGVKCWGLNANGELGDGTTTDRATPVDVSGLTDGVTAVAAHRRYTCALTTSGGVKCWGRNSEGQLGDGTTTQRLTPVDVSGLTNGVSAISADSDHTCALMVSGGVKCWGVNTYGQLGDGTTTQRLTPVDVSGLTSGVSAIAAGTYFSCALTTGGGAKCWGDNAYGELGNVTIKYSLTPVDVTGLTGGVTAIAAGGYHACAVTASGGAKCWGDNTYGQLGIGATIPGPTPVDVSGLASGVKAIAAANADTCALTTGGSVKCWGYNGSGQLGDGTATQRLTPVNVSGLSGGVIAIAAGDDLTCAVTTTGGVKCWGDNTVGQLGMGTTSKTLTPVDVSGQASGVTAISAGGYFACALTTGGGVKCWGINNYGQLGNNSLINSSVPVDVTGLTSGVSAIAAGGHHACALTTSGGVKCWGYNSIGTLGDGTTTHRLTPVDVSGLSSGVSAIAAYSDHTCALTKSGGLKCWGLNDRGQLGDGTTTQRLTPVNVSGLSSGVIAIAAGSAAIGNSFTCALTASGGAQCWGDNAYGQLGTGTIIPSNTPADVSGLTSGVNAITRGGFHTCALLSGGGLKCWGYNYQGQLGNGTIVTSLTPVDVSGLTSGMSAVAAGGMNTCALTTGGGAKCWGENGQGQLGDGTTTQRLTAVDVSGLTSGLSAISTGTNFSCVLTTGGGVKCWGDNSTGELGNGTKMWTPVEVVGFGGDAFYLFLPHTRK